MGNDKKDQIDRGDDRGERKEKSKNARVARGREISSSRDDERMRKASIKRFMKRVCAERDEAEQEEALIRAQESRELSRLRVEQAKKLGTELNRRKDNEILEQKNRQLVRNESAELKGLENQLQKADLARALQSQIREQQFRKEFSRIKQIQDELAVEAWYKGEGRKTEEALESYEKKEQYRRELEAQVASKKALQRQRNTEEKMLERAMLAEPRGLLVVGERAESLKEKKERAARLLEEQRAFLEARKARESRELEEIRREEAQRERILADKMIQRIQRDDAKIARLAAQDAILKKIMEKVESEEKRRREREEAVKELMEEEERFASESRLREEAEKKRQRMRDTMDDIRSQKMFKDQTRAKEEKMDRELHENLVKEEEKFAKDQQEEDNQRRAKGIEMGQDLKDADAIVRLRHVKYILDNQAELKKNQEFEKKRQEAIEKERLRMLREHGISL